MPSRSFKGLREPELAHDYLDDWRGREYDLTLNEIGKTARLILAGNGNMLERLLGPMPVLTTPLGQRLAELARGAISKRVAKHYQGFFRGMRREAEVLARDDKVTAKKLLYGYRVALTGVHLLTTGELVTDVRPLAQERQLDLVQELVGYKSSAEYQTVPPQLYARVLGDFEHLECLLEEALSTSPLPEQPGNEGEFDEFVVHARLGST